MIRKLTLKRFKRFEDETFTFPGNIVLAGPNNTGKTTVLQAIAAWSLAFNEWKTLNDFGKHKGAYIRKPIARQAFSAVPVRAFDLMWRERGYSKQQPIEIGIESSAGWTITMEFLADSTEQIYVRPRNDADPAVLRTAELKAVYVPGMTGLSTDEPVYQMPKIAQLLGQARPGEVLRNILVQALGGTAWNDLIDSIARLFGYELLPPNSSGAHILAEYKSRFDAEPLDIASAGSGFQQVLMLLAFLYTRPSSVLLLDEPDAHLHVILQDAIYGELRRVAQRQVAQLIVATHSEVIIDTVYPLELYAVLDKPKRLADNAEKARLIRSLKVLDNNDIMRALAVKGVLYTEDYPDLDILRAWADALDHPIKDALKTQVLWKPIIWEPREGASGVRCKDHFDALTMVRSDLRGLELRDGDGKTNPPGEVTGAGLQRLVATLRDRELSGASDSHPPICQLLQHLWHR